MNAYWITAKEYNGGTGFYRFCKNFVCNNPEIMEIRVSADTRYKMYINGELVSEGPCQGAECVHYFENEDVSSYVKCGENEIVIDVLYIDEQLFTTTFPKGQPSLWLDAQIIDGGEDKHIITDETWEVFFDETKEAFAGEWVFWSMPPFERMNKNKEIKKLTAVKLYEANDKNGFVDLWGTVDKYKLTKREIPQMRVGEKKNFTVTKKGENFIELDAGRYVTANIEFCVLGQKEKEIKLTYAESYNFSTDENNRLLKADRTDSSGFLRGPSDFVVCSGEKEVFKPFWFRTFRFIRIETDNIAELQFDISYREYNYPLNITAEFECSDEYYNKMWEISKNTALSCMHELYVDCPFYEQQQYNMDTALQGIFAFCLSNDARLTKKAIFELGASQLPEGILRASYPASYAQIIPSFSLYYIKNLFEYVKNTNDIEFAKRCVGTVYKILQYFENHINNDGVVFVENFWPFTDWAEGWDKGVPENGRIYPIAVLNMIYSTELKEAAELSSLIGQELMAQIFLKQKEELDKNIRNVFYSSEKKLFKNVKNTEEYTQHTAVWAVLSEIVTGDEAKELLKRSMSLKKCSFAMKYYLFRALEKTGLYEYADNLLDDWRAMVDKNCTTWCESEAYPRSECHGWSNLPAYELTRCVLGVKPRAIGFSEIEVSPFAGNLTFAKGKVPTPVGDVKVAWEAEDEFLNISVSVPLGVTAYVGNTVIKDSKTIKILRK